ncbi:MAG: VTT domain-containing protein [Candidatus Woesearchaeota archaeon]
MEFNNRSIIGLALISFFGSLFFLGFPGEIIFIVYTNIGYNIVLVFFIMLFFIMVAQFINYQIGYFIEKKWLENYIKHDKKHYHISLKKYDVYFILIFNILPLPADLLSVFLGIIKYDLKKAMLYTFYGKIIKFLFLILLFFLLHFIKI